MRFSLAFTLIALGLVPVAAAQTCTGLCLQQVACPSGTTTSITGTVFTPNGMDPLPNVLVYIPNAPVGPFTAGVSCPVIGQAPSGSPLVGTSSAVDGTFTLTNVPVGDNIPLVIQSGRWRRQLVIPSTTACANTAFSTRMPRNQSEGDIPRIAVATGSQDEVECVLRKVGLDDAEFTNPSGTGRVNLFSGSGSAGALVDASTPSQDALMGNSAALNAYDVLMLPCQGKAFTQTPTALANFIQFVNSGGRVYSSHFSYVWMNNNPPFDSVAQWDVNQKALPDGIATVDTSFSEGQTLAQWLQLVGASTTQGQIPISTLKHDLDGVVAPNQSWLTLNDAALNNPVMQFVFNTPVGGANQCGRVLFNEYHVETRTATTTGVPFPNECVTGAMTPQEKLLEFSLFELTNDGGVATLTPATQDFGSEPVGFTSAAQTFVWTNNSTFPASVSPLTVSGDFALASSNCSSVAAGASCQINVVFQPTVLGPRTGTLTVGSSGTNLLSTLTGIGTPDLAISSSTLTFGSQDVGTSSTKVLTVTNSASGSVNLPSLLISGDYRQSTNCGTTLPAHGTCLLTVTFTPSTTGSRTGAITPASGDAASFDLPVALTGTGVDFSLASSPGAGTVIAGYGLSMNAVATPIAGFSALVSLTCTTTAPASTCIPSSGFLVPAATPTAVKITTTSQYTVVGYSGLGAGGGLLWIVGAGSGLLLWSKRRSTGRLGRVLLIALLLAAGGFSLTGCSGMLPAINPVYTTPGTYTYTLTASDGILTHSSTFSLQVTAK